MKKEKTFLRRPLVWIVAGLAVFPLVITGLSHLVTTQSFAEVFLRPFTHAGAFAFEYLFLLFVCGAVYAASGRLWASFALPGFAFMILSLISHYKTVVNGTPLVLRDLALASQFSEVLRFALPQITLSLHTLASFALFIGACVGLFLFDTRIEKLFRPVIAGASAFCLLLFFFTPLFPAWALSLDKAEMSEEERTVEYGPAVGIYASYIHGAREEEEFIAASLEILDEQIESGEDAPAAQPVKTPTVIFLMSESFFDVTKLPNVSFSQDPVPNFRSLSESCTSGSFISTAYCGGTGYVEMEVLTGICSNLLSGSDTLTSLSPDSVYSGIPTIADVFASYGYRTGFVHSYNANLYNREAIYKAFGFDDILFEDSFESDAEMRGGYISDMALCEKIISMYEQKGDDPMFLFAVSMENHQPYTAEKFSEVTVTPQSDVLSAQELVPLTAYVNGLHDADAALGRLSEYFSAADEPVMIVFFGDHLPNLMIGEEDTVYTKIGYASTSTTTEWGPDELLKMLSTDYVIWTNYEEGPLPDGVQSSNMLGLSVLTRLGFELDGYYEWLRSFVAPSLLIYRPRLYVDAMGNAYPQIPAQYRSVMENYKAAVYDIVYGGGTLFDIAKERGGVKDAPGQ